MTYLYLINSHKCCLNVDLLKSLLESLVPFHWCFFICTMHYLCGALHLAGNNFTVWNICRIRQCDFVRIWPCIWPIPAAKVVTTIATAYSISVRYHQHHRSQGITPSPPIKFGCCQSHYMTFANPERFCPKSFFWLKASH